MSTLSAKWAYAIAAVAGAAGWIAIAQVAGRREAWDSELYFTWFLPSLALIIAALAFWNPDRIWRWAFVPFAAQALVAFAQNPTGSLMPMGLVVFGIYGAVCLVPAWAGAAMRRRVDRSKTVKVAVEE
jgi:hypothetical protein